MKIFFSIIFFQMMNDENIDIQSESGIFLYVGVDANIVTVIVIVLIVNLPLHFKGKW